MIWHKYTYANNVLRRWSVINNKERKMLYGFQGGILGCGNSKKAVKREKEFKTNKKVSGRGGRKTLSQNFA